MGEKRGSSKKGALRSFPPEARATKVATIVGNAAQAPIFVYDRDALLADGTTHAAGRRVGFFIHNSTAANVSDDDLKLLDAAISWANAP